MNGQADTVDLRVTPSFRASCTLVASVFIAAWLQYWLINDHLSLATIYFGPGVFLASLYIVERSRRTSMLAALFLAQAAGLMAAGMFLGAAVVTSLMVAGQAWGGSTVLRKLAPRGLDFTQTRAYAQVALVALLVTPPAGLATRELLIHLGRLLVAIAPVLAGFHQVNEADTGLNAGILVVWVFPVAIGVLLATPLVIGFATPMRNRQVAWLSGASVLVLSFNALATLAIFFSDGHSYLFLICPPLVLAGLRLGVRDTASALLISLCGASIATALGYGPIEILQIDPGQRTLFLELAYLCACACIMPIAASLEARRSLEAELASSLEFSGQILSNMHEIVFRTDHRGRWIFLNPAWEQVTGYGVAETLGRNYTSVLVPEDKARAASLYAGLVSGEMNEMKIQQRICRRDGEIRHIDVSARAFRSAEGSYLGTTGTIRDISEHRRYVEALEASERRFRQLCDTAPVGIIRCDRFGMLTYANRKLEQIVLTGLAELIGLPWLDVLKIEEAGLSQRLDEALGSPGAVFEQELGFRDGAGQDRWLIFTATGKFDADALLIGYIAAVNDITARKTAEAELANKTDELRLLADNINDVVFRLGLDGICLYVTPSVRDVIGADPQDMVGRRHFLKIHPDDAVATEEAFRQLVQGALRHCTFAYRVLTEFPDPDYVWLEANCRLLRDEAGRPYEVVAVVRDITERKRLELGIIEAGRRAELATLAKSAFIANLSHEIRTPMNGVIGLTDLLLGRELDEASRRYVKLISESGAAMMQLLNDILDISKIDSGRLQLASSEFDLHKCLANALGLMTASAAGKQLDLRLDIAPGVPCLMLGDSHRLRQVLTNLIGNAVKFTQAGHVAVDARIEGGDLVIRVADTGIGIAEAQQAAVFEEFVQANPEISSGYGGTGLGLSISRRIAEAMGGTLTLTSQPGQGTTMILQIPARFTGPLATPAPAAPAVIEQAPPAAATALRVLVAEDNRTNQIIINGMLQRLGHSAAIAQDGEEVIAMAQQAAEAGEPYDLVLMDVQMPKLDGNEATRRLRSLGFTPARLPIIALTANGYREDIEACLAAGMQDHLTKPVRLAELQAALATLGLRPGTTAGSSPPVQNPIQVE